MDMVGIKWGVSPVNLYYFLKINIYDGSFTVIMIGICPYQEDYHLEVLFILVWCLNFSVDRRNHDNCGTAKFPFNKVLA